MRIASFRGSLDGVVDFPSMHGNFSWSLNTQSDLVTTNLHHHDGDFIVDDDTLVLFAR